MSAESYSEAEPARSTRQSAEWICEALADIAQALEPGHRGQVTETARDLAMHLERIGDELARLNRTLEGIALLMANQQGGEEGGEG